MGDKLLGLPGFGIIEHELDLMVFDKTAQVGKLIILSAGDNFTQSWSIFHILLPPLVNNWLSFPGLSAVLAAAKGSRCYDSL
jgi:hypothetical protein